MSPRKTLNLEAGNALTVAEAAELLHCSEKTLRRMISRGDVRAYRIGRMIRLSRTDLQAASRPASPNANLLER